MKKKVCKFNEGWKADLRFKGWIVKLDNVRAKCRFCNVEFNYEGKGVGALISHQTSLTHSQTLKTMGGPSKDIFQMLKKMKAKSKIVTVTDDPAVAISMSLPGPIASTSHPHLNMPPSNLPNSASEVPSVDLSATVVCDLPPSAMPASTSDLPASASDLPASTSDLPASASDISVSTSDLPASISDLPPPDLCAPACDLPPPDLHAVPQRDNKTIKSYMSTSPVLEAEILWTVNCVENNHSYLSAERSMETIKRMCSDSIIAQKLAIKRTKMTYLTNFGIAPYIKSNLKMQLNHESDLVLLFDESLNHDIGQKQMDIHVRFWDTDMVSLFKLKFIVPKLYPF